MRLQVSPDGLGPVEVRVVVRADAVQAALYAQHDAARDALETHRSSLETALGRAQLRLEGFTVGLGHHRQGAPADHHERGERWVGPGGPVAVAGPSPTPVTDAPARPAAGLSLRA
jgi:hypothetical protein